MGTKGDSIPVADDSGAENITDISENIQSDLDDLDLFTNFNPEIYMKLHR